MINTDNLDYKSVLVCSGISTARGIFISSFTHPLDVIKTQLQDVEHSRKISAITKAIFQEHGIWGFYRGLTPKITGLLVKEWWRWPTIIYFPGYIERNYSLSPFQAQIVTGLVISTLDTGMTAPFERYKIQSITGTLPPKGKTIYENVHRIFHGGWRGFTPYWCRASVGWVSFSTSQRYIRDEYKNLTHKTELNSLDLAIIGVAVGGVLSLTLAPFDIANTRGQSRDISMKELWRTAKKMPIKSLLRHFWRGAPLQALISTINNITSVALIDKLSVEFD